jgi:CBS domain containing-hemolysin-like protein
VTHHLDAYLSASQLGITLTGLIIGWVGEGSVCSFTASFNWQLADQYGLNPDDFRLF